MFHFSRRFARILSLDIGYFRRGGLAVGIASSEIRRYGLNPIKRRRLIRAGADIIISDYSQLNHLCKLLNL